MKELLQMIKTALILFLVLWVLFFFIIGIKMVPNDDMFPKMNAGDIMLYYKFNKAANLQDVVVLKKNGTEYVGRIVAQGGDTVEITDEENLLVNGNLVTEITIYSSTPRYEGFVEYPLKLAEDECFVLSDKRDGGEDSRYYGPIKTSELRGTVIGLYRRAGF